MKGKLTEIKKKMTMALDIDKLLQISEFVNADGVIGIGSFFSGRENGESDIDLFVIKDSDCFIKKTIAHENSHLDLSICSLPYLAFNLIRSKERLYWQEVMDTAVILKDDLGNIRQCLNWVKQNKQKEISPSTDVIIRKTKALIENNARKIFNLHNDEQILLYYYLSEWNQHTYELRCLEDNVTPFIYPKYQIRHIKDEYPALIDMMNEIYESSFELKKKLVKKFTKEHVENFGTHVSKYGVIFQKNISNSKLKGMLPPDAINII